MLDELYGQFVQMNEKKKKGRQKNGYLYENKVVRK